MNFIYSPRLFELNNIWRKYLLLSYKHLFVKVLPTRDKSLNHLTVKGHNPKCLKTASLIKNLNLEKKLSVRCDQIKSAVRPSEMLCDAEVKENTHNTNIHSTVNNRKSMIFSRNSESVLTGFLRRLEDDSTDVTGGSHLLPEVITWV